MDVARTAVLLALVACFGLLVASVVADRLNKVDGVTATETHIAFRTYSRHDLESAFSLGLD